MYKKRLLAFICCFITLIGHNLIIHASNIEISDPIYEEYLEKKANGYELYELIDEEGNIFGYYEPCTQEEIDQMPQLRYSSSINWTISAGSTSYGTNRYTLESGMQIHLNISQNRTGTSYLRFYDHDRNSYHRFLKTISTNGWSGIIFTFGDGLSYGTYSFGIENASSNTITYSGNYSL